jgi:hypothetical protein
MPRTTAAFRLSSLSSRLLINFCGGGKEENKTKVKVRMFIHQRRPETLPQVSIKCD